MMNFLRYLEKAWIAGGICALVIMIYNLVTLRTFDSRVYFPLFCFGACMMIWYNIRGQRKFRASIMEENRARNKQQ